MLRSYLDAAMRRAKYEILPEDGQYYGEIPELAGVWATAESLERCRDELASVLEEWVVMGLRLGHDIPVLDGISLPLPQAV